MPFKRKSESAQAGSQSTATPTKRARASLPAGKQTAESGTPQTGEKRKRGRPRKNPEDLTPKPVRDGPTRGRGRPKKILTAAQAAAKEAAAAVAAAAPKRGRGRPRKSTEAAAPAKAKTGAGRGRPRKSLPANDDIEERSIFDAKPDASAKDKLMADVKVPKEGTGRSYWLMKAEPESRMEKGVDVKFSIDDLAAADVPEAWDGVRNPVARNLMRDMKKGDYALFYHSNCKVPAVVGIMEIVQEHSPDEAAFKPEHPYYDPKSKRDEPKWVVVHVEFRRKFDKPVTLNDLKANSDAGKPLENLQTLKQSRLSVSSVTPAQWRYILELAGEDPDELAGKDLENDLEQDLDDDISTEL